MKTIFLAASIFVLSIVTATYLIAQNCPGLPSCKFDYTINPDGFTVKFDGQVSCEPGLQINWDFGDGDITSGNGIEDPTHIYSQDHDYVVIMTVNLPVPNTGCLYTYTQVIHIAAGTPGALWLTLDGPTLAVECQEVIYTAQVVGGVPPYICTWLFDNACGTCLLGGSCFGGGIPNTRSGGPVQTIQFHTGTAHCSVTVTDAQGHSATETWDVNVKSALTKLEIRTTAEPPPSNSNCGDANYLINTSILFWPDIDPLFTFDYPTDYYWDYGDGQTDEDRFDGGGEFLHSYTAAGTKMVKLKVCDPNGCMQTTKTLKICDPSAGPVNTDCKLINGDHPTVETTTLDYIIGGYASTINLAVIDLPSSCSIPQKASWTVRMVDCGLGVLPGYDNLQADNTNLFLNLLYEPWWQANKPWGCMSVTGNVKGNGYACEHCTGAYTTKNCIAYIMPNELEVSDFLVEGSCTDYVISALIKGGGWKKVNNKFLYKDIVWKAYDTYDHEKELTDIFMDVQGEPGKKKINLNNPYFKQFGPHQFVEFLVKLKVQDFANGSVETSQLIAFNPFRLHLEDKYERCPGIQSQFSHDPLATGGSDGPYTFAWSPTTLTGENPTFTAPATGVTAIYSLTVTDGPGCSATKTTTVTGTKPLGLDIYPTIPSCASTNCGRPIVPTDIGPSGGSGHYQYHWSPASYLSATDIFNPFVQGIPTGQTVIYTLQVTDEYGGCTASNTKSVNSYSNDLTLTLPATKSICYGTADILPAQGQPAPSGWNGIGYQYSWTTNNPHHTGIENEHSSSLPISALISSYPGTYTYTARYSNFFTGCFAEKTTTVTVQQNWTHVGYLPTLKSAIAGSSKSLWVGSENYTTSIFPNKNNITVLWSPANPATQTFFGNPPTQLPIGGNFIPTVTMPYLTMKVTDNGTGCFKEYKTQRYIISDEQPELWISGDNPIVCKGGSTSGQTHQN